MQKAQYPERQCREHVYNGVGMGYNCELPDLHPGPHANLGVRDSVRVRDRWEDQNPDWREKIGQPLDEV